MRRTIWHIVTLFVALWSCAMPLAGWQRSGGEMRPPKQDYNSGEYLYRAFCASCHGSHGTGDGSVANILRVPPSNLTQIARRNGGVFPRDRIFAAIDGRQTVRGHGPGEMPIWSDVLKTTESQNEAVIRKRLDALVTYVESLQSPP
jgi:mono/diheme cytochrome c family protein